MPDDIVFEENQRMLLPCNSKRKEFSILSPVTVRYANMSFFVSFPLSLLAHNQHIFQTCISRKMSLELRLDAQVLDELDTSYHTFLAGEFQKAGLSCAIHLPFFDLCPGSPDPLIREASCRRLVHSLEVARLYRPVHLLAHTGFHEHYCDCFSEWSASALSSWTSILASWPDHPFLYFENVHDRDPGIMQDFLGELASSRCGFCLDIGHWYSFARGSNSRNLALWLQKLAPYLGHLHLHDNSGLRDRHQGLGNGTVPWDEVFASLEIMDLEPSITLEPHTSKDLQDSLEFMKEHFSWFSRLGVSKTYLNTVMAQDIPAYC